MTFKKTNGTRKRVIGIPLPNGILSITEIALTTALLISLTPAHKVQADISAKAFNRHTTPHDMVLIPAGQFVMGNEGAYSDELPLHKVLVNAFYMDEHEVTNAQFSNFVKATGYVTKAEKDGSCWAYFHGETYWQFAVGTDWQHPQGPNSTINDKLDHPVVCVTWEDVAAYAKWAGKRLPTEAEWEYAARAGSHGHFIAITNGNNNDHSSHTGNTQMLAMTDRSPSSKSHTDGTHHLASAENNHEIAIKANVWQGHWPENNQLNDGFYYTAPVASFDANKMGVHDMLGNVWEWTADWYDSTYYAFSPTNNPQGPENGKNRVARGGSWFCSPNYCGAYSTHYRGASPTDHAFNNVGFRCAKDVIDENN